MSLSQSEYEVLKQFTKSETYRALGKLLDSNKDTLYNELCSELELPKIYVLQGKIQGLNMIMNLPRMAVIAKEAAFKRKEKKDEHQEKIEASKKRIKELKNL